MDMTYKYQHSCIHTVEKPKILKCYCTDIGDYCPELGYRKKQACEHPQIFQPGTIFPDINVITLLLYYSCKDYSSVLSRMLSFLNVSLTLKNQTL